MVKSIINKTNDDLGLNIVLSPKNILRKIEIKKAIEHFKSQFDSVLSKDFSSEVDIRLNFNNTIAGNAILSQSAEKKVIHINVNRFYSTDGTFLEENLIRTLNHEYLHYLDYKANEKYNAKEAFSEEVRVNKNEVILNFQKSILFGEIYDSSNNMYNINDFDNALFTNILLDLVKNDEEFSLIDDTKINQLMTMQSTSFSTFMNHYENKIFQEKIDNITSKIMEEVADTKSVAFDFFDNLAKNIDNILLNNGYQTIMQKLENKTIAKTIDHDIVINNFIELCGNDMPFSGKNETIFHLRNLFYTRTLDFYNESPSKNYLRVFAQKPLLWYTGEASEKLSFSGDKNASVFIHDYFDLVMNNNINKQYAGKRTDRNSIVSISDLCMRNVRNFIDKNTDALKLKERVEKNRKFKF